MKLPPLTSTSFVQAMRRGRAVALHMERRDGPRDDTSQALPLFTAALRQAGWKPTRRAARIQPRRRP